MCINATVSNEIERKEKWDKLQQIRLEKRLPIDIEVFVSLEKKKTDLVKEFSKDADIIFLGINPPPKDSDQIEQYLHYLEDLTTAYEGFPLAFVLSAESTHLKTILE